MKTDAPIPDDPDTPNMNRLRRMVWRLYGLLQDPHPGLITWHAAYERQMREINDFWTGKDQPPNERTDDEN